MRMNMTCATPPNGETVSGKVFNRCEVSGQQRRKERQEEKCEESDWMKYELGESWSGNKEAGKM